MSSPAPLKQPGIQARHTPLMQHYWRLLWHPDRAVCFEDIVASIEIGGLLDDIGHSNSDKYPDQRMYIVFLNGYVFCVPYIEDDEAVFLKTAYPSRKFTAIYLTGDNHD